MIAPILTTPTASSYASLQQNSDMQSVLHSQNASKQVREEERQVRESVVHKEEAVFYHQNHDAKEEGRNKYSNPFAEKKKKQKSDDESSEIKRVNFDIRL